MRNEFTCFIQAHTLLKCSVISDFYIKKGNELRKNMNMYGSNESTLHFKNKENILLAQNTVYSHKQKLLILKAGQEWYIRQQLSV
jgi:hypothetical protein